MYVHIPFCKVKCRYCAFAVFPGLRKETVRYIQALQKEMSFHNGLKIDTLYFGGGTPSLLTAENWAQIFSAAKTQFSFAPGTEITIECNPENIGIDLLGRFRVEGVNRLSIGLQSSDDDILKRIGRTHTFADFSKAWRLCRENGFDNLSVDLIMGLPGQTHAKWQETLRRVLDLSPEHLSLYPLDIEKKSAFYFDGVTADQELQADLYEWSAEQLASRGYEHYEICSFALPGRKCRHNLKYWRNEPCLGIGVSAAGYDGTVRYKNMDKFWDYVKTVESGKPPVEEQETLAPAEQLREQLLLGLRMKDGIAFTENIRTLYGAAVKELISQDLLTASADGSHLLSTRKGWLLSSHVYRELAG